MYLNASLAILYCIIRFIFFIHKSVAASPVRKHQHKSDFFFFKEQLQALSRLKTWHQLNVVPLKKKSLTVLSITLTTRYKDSFLAITQKRSIKVDKSVVWGLMCDSFISWEFLKADLSCVLLPTVHSAVVLQ